jgi:diguanylate cyclase (GGDEF)-like protein
MNWPYVLALFVSTAAAIYVCIVAWERRSAPGARLEKGYQRAEHFRTAFLLFIEQLGVKLPATLSLGVATYPQHGATWEEVLRAADQAMYAAKEAGRNCTRTAN